MKSGKYPLNRVPLHLHQQGARQAARSRGQGVLQADLSKEGQEVVIKDGYLPLPAEIAKQELAKLE